jgi:hypothetical protein
MLRRDASAVLGRLARGFPVVALTGPRQSGKTTLARAAFRAHEYLSLEDLDVRAAAREDPRGFLASRSLKGFILDEVQHAPDLLSYLQTFVDARKEMGKVVVTGSQNLLLLERIAQSLAGRVGLLELLPFRMREVAARRPEFALDDWLFHGLFPPLYDRDVEPRDWYPRYIQTYVDRDVRSIKNITDLASFHRFVRLCAGRVGALINYGSLASDCGIDLKTAQSWMSVLEASYLVFPLRPHHENFHKRLIKQRKLYFADTGLLCSLLGIETPGQIATHPLRGGIFENFLFLEFLKERFNAGRPSNLYFWRDHVGHEVDLLLEEVDGLRPIEFKKSQTLGSGAFEDLLWFQRQAGSRCLEPTLIHEGEHGVSRSGVRTLGWRALAKRPRSSGAILAAGLNARRAAARRKA